MTKSVIIRLDDVGRLDPRNRIIRDLCLAGLRVTCAVVPCWLESGCTEFLLQIAEEFPGQVEVHQHGYAHTNYSTDESKYEFGGARSADEQMEDIEAGREILMTAFGSLLSPVFTPPYGRLNIATLKCLKILNFFCISTFFGYPLNPVLPDLAPDIDGFWWHPKKEKPWRVVVSEWERPVRRELRGFLLHPRHMSDHSIDAYCKHLPHLLEGRAVSTFADIIKSFGE